MSDPSKNVRRATRRKVTRRSEVGEIESRPDVGPQRSDVPKPFQGRRDSSNDVMSAFAVVGLVSAGVTISAGDTLDKWYDGERKNLHLPSSLISIVWVALYLLVPVIAWKSHVRVVKDRSRHFSNLLFSVQLLLSLVWVVAFSVRNLDLAFMALLLSLAAVIWWWYTIRNSSGSSYLVLYMAWMVYLLVLTSDLIRQT